MTRYEIAQMVARMMANGVGGADADKLKALIVEFAPELEALGVKVDGFDGRLSALEKGVGRWTIWGSMYFDFINRKTTVAGDTKKTHGSEFRRARLQMKRDLSDKVTFESRWNGGNRWDRWWVTARDFLGAQGLKFRAGQFLVDLEGRDNLFANNQYWDDDANFLDATFRGFDFDYNRGGLNIYAFAGSDNESDVYKATNGDEVYAARIAYNAEKFFVSANGVMFNGLGNGKDKDAIDWHDTKFKAYWFALGFKPVKGLSLVGAYYKEDIDSLWLGGTDMLIEDKPKMWKVVLDLNQDLLKFTSLRGEFAKYDKGFFVQNGTGPMSWSGWDKTAMRGPMAEDTKLLKVSAIQKWGAKFSTYERYVHYDQDNNGKAKQLQFGIGYQYSPNLQFIVDYTKHDGLMSAGKVDHDYEDKVIRFRTFLSF
jgi:hypothetical protein